MNTKIDRLAYFKILNGESHSSLLDEFDWFSNTFAMLALTARLHVGFERATQCADGQLFDLVAREAVLGVERMCESECYERFSGHLN